MTEEYLDNPDVSGAALSRPHVELDQGIFELMVDGSATDVWLSWKRVHVDLREELLQCSDGEVLRFRDAPSLNSA